MGLRLNKLLLLIVAVLGLFFVLDSLWQIKNHSQEKPLIGILLNDGGEGGYSIYPWYVMRQNYSEVIAKNGGIPVFIGHDSEIVDDYVKLLDGIVFTGGDFAVPIEAYTSGIPEDYKPKPHSRDGVEYPLIKLSYNNNIPVLGVCGGMQQMNVVFGGTLYENLKGSLNTPIQHRNENLCNTVHKVDIKLDSKLYQIVKAEQLAVNSCHHAGLRKVANNLAISSTSSDGVIESIEAKNKHFFIGVQWHPEFELSDEEKKLWQAFVEAAKERHAKKA